MKLLPPSHEEALSLLVPLAPLLPNPSGFLRPYVEWAVTQTDAPARFHLAVGLTILSAACPLRTGMRMGTSLLAPNLFTLVVGRAGTERKSYSVRIGRKLLEAADPERVGESFGSYEGMLSSLKSRPIQLVGEEEFSRQLDQTKQGAYLHALKLGMAQAYDGGSLGRHLAKRGAETIEGYRLSFMGAINYKWFEENTDTGDWEGGNIPRFLVVLCARDRHLALGQQDSSPLAEANRTHLIAQLQRVMSASPGMTFSIDNETLYPDPKGKYPEGVTPAYGFAGWSQKKDAQVLTDLDSGADAMYHTVAARAVSPLAPKLAVLFAIDRLLGENRLPALDTDTDRFGILHKEVPLQVELSDLAVTIAMVDQIHLPDVKTLSSTIVYSASMRLRRRVLSCIPENSDGICKPLLLKAAGMLKKEIQPILDTLLEEGTIRMLTPDAVPTFYRSEYVKVAQLSVIPGGRYDDPSEPDGDPNKPPAVLVRDFKVIKSGGDKGGGGSGGNE